MEFRTFNHKHSLPELWKLRKPLLLILLSPAKIFNFLLLKITSAFKIKRAPAHPAVLMVEASSECDFRCPMCPRQYLDFKRKEPYMTLEVFSRLLENCGRRLMFLALWNFGEPFLNPDIFEMIKLAKKYRIIVGVSTNGSFLSESNIHKLIESGLDYMIVCVDSDDEEIYENYRPGGDFKKVTAGIASLIKIRDASGKKTPFVNLQSILLKDTAKRTSGLIELGRRLKADKVSFKKVTYANIIKKELLPADKNCFRFTGASSFCSRPFFGAVVLSDGDVLACCNDLRSSRIMGNIQDEAFLSIWGNEKFKSFRAQLSVNFAEIDICKDCLSGSFSYSFSGKS
ncbi:MAG: radical SAM protein [Candidatus Omnitrophica bacterium]|nr:radical SAM protein [Candidatus Omnitrophota bacterium]